jgi:hypothetical protein
LGFSILILYDSKDYISIVVEVVAAVCAEYNIIEYIIV